MFHLPDPILLLRMEDHEWQTDTFRNLLRDLGELICAVAGQIRNGNIWKKAEGMMRCPTVMRLPFLFHLILPNNDNFLIALKDSPTILGVYRLTLTVISVFDVAVKFQFFWTDLSFKTLLCFQVFRRFLTRGAGWILRCQWRKRLLDCSLRKRDN